VSRKPHLEVITGNRVEDVPSPCVNVCRMNDATGFCEGCFRTLDEIACWSGYTREEKLAVRAKLDVRRRASP
jgi:predicted Fe-S protein YdhL (DUF1289 family)